MGFLAMVEFGLLAPEMPFGLRHLHSFASPQPDEVGLELGNHGEEVEEQPSDRIGGIVDGPTQVQTHLSNLKFVGDRPCIREGPRQPVELGDNQRVAFSTGGQGFTQARPFAIGASQSMVNAQVPAGDPLAGGLTGPSRGEGITSRGAMWQSRFVMNAPSAWHSALMQLPMVQTGQWAVSGSAALALHGLAVEPQDLDIVADEVAATELVDGLGDLVTQDISPWDRGDVRAARRALVVLEGIDAEILVEVETVALGTSVLGPPDLNHLDYTVINDRQIPVLPLSTMLALLDATGKTERATMVREAMSGEVS